MDTIRPTNQSTGLDRLRSRALRIAIATLAAAALSGCSPGSQTDESQTTAPSPTTAVGSSPAVPATIELTPVTPDTVAAAVEEDASDMSEAIDTFNDLYETLLQSVLDNDDIPKNDSIDDYRQTIYVHTPEGAEIGLEENDGQDGSKSKRILSYTFIGPDSVIRQGYIAVKDGNTIEGSDWNLGGDSDLDGKPDNGVNTSTDSPEEAMAALKDLVTGEDGNLVTFTSERPQQRYRMQYIRDLSAATLERLLDTPPSEITMGELQYIQDPKERDAVEECMVQEAVRLVKEEGKIDEAFDITFNIEPRGGPGGVDGISARDAVEQAIAEMVFDLIVNGDPAGANLMLEQIGTKGGKVTRNQVQKGIEVFITDIALNS